MQICPPGTSVRPVRRDGDLVLARSGGEVSGPGFAVVDVETTGLSPRQHRVLEIAVVRTDVSGRVLDEWCTLVDPQGPVGATHVHGIGAEDVADAPTFAQVAGVLCGLLRGRAVVAHNARFDLGFVRAEFERAGWQVPQLPSLCTLEASRLYLPQLQRRKLVDCCAAVGVSLEHAHSALGDTRATAQLLASYLDEGRGSGPVVEHRELPSVAARVPWPGAPAS